MTEKSELSIRPLTDGEETQVIMLWKKAGLTRPHNNPEKDIAFARQCPSSEVLVGLLEDNICASVMVGVDGHRGAVYYVAVDPDLEGSGHGRLIMEAAEDWLRQRGVWKLNLMVRSSNEKVHGFYDSLGYRTEPRTVFSKFLDGSDHPPAD